MEKTHNRQAYNDFFLEELAKLNPVQQSAAEHFDGPMLVVAGPGTGKTQLLAARIGRILLETDTLPENILCLTFTDAGTVAVRERLRKFIGPAAHRVHIFTFHAFCNTVIRDHTEYFGSNDLQPLSDLERIDLIRKIMDGLPPGHPLYRGGRDPYFYEKGLQLLFQRMNAEDWTPDFIKHAAQEWLEQLPDRPEFRYQRNTDRFRKGDLKIHKIEEITRRMGQLGAAADLYPAYEELKTASKRYDYDDMVLWVIRAFDRHPFLLRNYQERYLYFLVDEYQDTNGAQNEILLKLIRFWQNPNVFIVGDDDQSIYEFQGARLKNLLDFRNQYKETLEVLTLNENYRSSQLILDWADALIGKNQIRLLNFIPGAQKALTAANPQRQLLHQPPVIREYPNRLQETVHVVQQIESLLDAGRPANEIAVICAQHKQAELLNQLLIKKNIPCTAKRGIDLVQEPIIAKIIQILDYIRHEARMPHSGEALLFKILHFRFWDNSSLDIAKISFAINQTRETNPLPWRIAVQDPAFLQNLGLSHPKNILKATEILETLIQEEANLALPNLLEQLINQTGITASAITDNQLPTLQTECLFNFLSFVYEECQRYNGMNLEGLFQLIERMKDNGIPLPFFQQSQLEQGVQLLTAHSAKGLEFADVFLLDVVKERWEPLGRNPSGSFQLPETLSWFAEEDAMEARRRLFYVAMTRAEQGLYISFARQNEKGKPLYPARFIDELLEKFPESLQRLSVPAREIQAAQISLIQNAPAPKLPDLEKSLVDAQLSHFRLSISALNSFLNCPLEFYFNFIVHAPQIPGDAAVFGQAMHLAMKRLFLNMRSAKDKSFPPVQTFLGYFMEAMLKKKGILTAAAYQSYLEQGKRALELLYAHNIGQWHKDVSVEYTVRQVELDGVPITGTIDKIEYHPGLSIGVVDYKTGRHAEERTSGPTPANPFGGTYWRQLVFYKLLFEALDRSSRSVNFGEIVYLEPDLRADFKTHRIAFQPEDVQLMRTLIRDVYARILNHDFYKGCGTNVCPWCALSTQEILPPSLRNPEIEALDD
ncbi:MAG: ATP-dependent helicase [Saprospiraceae bacterium]|jgi:DNA helicase-2/ATP-dependent DNA helicase PcrA